MLKIRITLTDAASGDWTTEGVLVASGVKIPEDRNYTALGDALQAPVTAYMQRHFAAALDDAHVDAWDPNATDLGDPIPGGAAVCVFRYRNGECEVMASRGDEDDES